MISLTLRKIVTIGAYGFDESGFFRALEDARVDTFCDVRLRRGMRGSTYAFANSKHLQNRLSGIGIRYIHAKNLAPSQEIRELQHTEDAIAGTLKRTRTALGLPFVQAYETICLADFDAGEFVKALGLDAQIVALFCVEREPSACHRSLVAARLANDLGIEVQHIKP